jgi:soluble lytic murein transglycosylase-like protein
MLFKLIIILGVALMPYRRYYISAETEEIIIDKQSQAIAEYSKKFNVEVPLIQAVIKVESIFNPFAVRYEKHLKDKEWYTNLIPRRYKKDKYAYCSMGYMQILYGVARSYGFRGSPQALMDPDKSIRYGTEHLSMYLKKYKRFDSAISSYNQGSPRRQTNGQYRNQTYVNAVKKYYLMFGGKRK